jgi:hypothetical protein
LLSELAAGTDPHEAKLWPESPQAVFRYLERNTEALHAWGLAIQFNDQDYGPRLISIRWVKGFPGTGNASSFADEQGRYADPEQVTDLRGLHHRDVDSERHQNGSVPGSSDANAEEQEPRASSKAATQGSDWHDIRNSLQGFDACNTVPTNISHRILNTALVILVLVAMLLLTVWFLQGRSERNSNAQNRTQEQLSGGASVGQEVVGSEGYSSEETTPVVSTSPTPQLGTQAEVKPPQSDHVAVRSLEIAAQHGDADAQFQLANLFAEGRGVPQDLVIAYAWYVIADAGGNPKSKDAMRQVGAKLPPGGIASVRSKLGQMYANGSGVPKDYTKAYTWFSLAEAAGDQQSEREKELLTQRMTEQEIAEGSSRAADWLRKH